MLGYFGRMPGLEPELAGVWRRCAGSGVRTVMDAAGEGGDWDTLAGALPHLDVFVPSLREARGHTGLDDPERICNATVRRGRPGVIGVKLGADGALLGDAQIWANI